MADDGFEVPRLAQLYDPLDPDRSDLDVYAAIVDELGARSVLDVGCGTGTFACLLAARGSRSSASTRRGRRWTSPRQARRGPGALAARRRDRRCRRCRWTWRR